MSLIRALDNGSISKYYQSGRQQGSFWLVLGLALLLLPSCNSKKYLKEGQSFLSANAITIKSKHRIDNKSELYDELIALYQQRQTKLVVPGLPRHVLYYQYLQRRERKPDSKQWSEDRINKNKPVIYDSLKSVQTCQVFENHLARRGYRAAQARFISKTDERLTTVAYHIDLGPRIYIDTFLIMSRDHALQQIMDEHPENTHIEKGSPLDIKLFTLEKQRIVNILQNEGYATFDENFISPLEIDTSGQRTKAVMRLLNPSDTTFHQKHYVGRIRVYPDYDDRSSTHYVDTTLNQITYYIPDSSVFTLKPELIERNIVLKPGELTRRDDVNRSIRNLGRIELLRFTNWSGYTDTTNIDTPYIDYTFSLNRNKKIYFTAASELTYSTIAAEQRRSLAGVNFNLNYRDRNMYQGAEVLNLNLDMGFEFNFQDVGETSTNNLFNTFNGGFGSNLTFPRFMDPFRLYHMIGHTRDPERPALIANRLRHMLLNDATSSFGAGYNYVNIRNLYEYHSFNANLTYNAQPDPFRRLTIDRFGFDVFVPFAKPAFQLILDKNPFLRESWGKQLFTGLLFRNYLFEIKSRNRPQSGYFKFIHSAEVSGLEMWLINSLFSPDEEILLGPKDNADGSVQFSHFVKGEMDIRYYKPLGRDSEFALRFNLGAAKPVWPYTTQVPFVKQYYVGGALSNRGWQIRELGPGSFQDTTPTDPNQPFYRTGDLKIDISGEFRFPIIWYFKGAIFADASNVWTLKYDPARPGADFKPNRFLKEFAISYGLGIRMDLDFFILRFDLGYKLHNPYPVNGSRWLTNELKKFPGGAEPQIAVGLPF